MQDLRARLRQGFVVPNTGLPAPLADGAEGLPGSVGVKECAAIKGHAQDHLLRGDMRHVDVMVKRGGGAEWCALRVGRVRVDVCLMTGDFVPGTGVVVSMFCERHEGGDKGG